MLCDWWRSVRGTLRAGAVLAHAHEVVQAGVPGRFRTGCTTAVRRPAARRRGHSGAVVGIVGVGYLVGGLTVLLWPAPGREPSDGALIALGVVIAWCAYALLVFGVLNFLGRHPRISSANGGVTGAADGGPLCRPRPDRGTRSQRRGRTGEVRYCRDRARPSDSGHAGRCLRGDTARRSERRA